jgi:hypothetical protein
MGKRTNERSEFDIAFKWCVANGYTMYLVPIGSGTWKSPPKCKIEIDYFGKTKQTEEIYKQDEKAYDKIREYYIDIYNKKHKT